MEINNLDVSDLSWVSSPLELTARPFYQSSISSVELLKREIEMQAQTIENKKEYQHDYYMRVTKEKRRKARKEKNKL